ncbi:TolC family protein [Hyphomonas pacifica]|jgi:cobalt-zinc-cadmium efflux system outer membrane protein|uniref:Transporter n=1 Tax=Hyphomonas pacifica TaxID=1280941 RepID=A0A062U3T2_9PROT|nr:TolC family protein [Hyphomonas pacifica]KCZ50800.1 hypothetical protein HY2_02795 [Hyphomonas pacifica]RAN34505.1 hypothetical protein HY3_11065 [Hyphomonas pacifica]
MQQFLWATLFLALSLPAQAQAGFCETGPDYNKASDIDAEAPLTLDAVLSEIRRASPETRVAGLEILARAADAEQAGRPLNPVLSIELEEFAGSGALSGLNEAETTIGVEQTLQLGGKRQRAQAAARALTALASAECAVILRETELQGTILFYDYVHALNDAALLETAAETAEELASTVRKRVAAGAAPPPEQIRAESAAASAEASASFAKGLSERRRYELASLWGEANPLFTLAEAEDSAFGARLSTETQLAHPELDRATASDNALRAAIDVERAAAMPDITVSAGFRRFESTGDSAVVAGVSVPLPLFDRNRGATRAAEIRAEAGQINVIAVEARLRAQQRGAVAAVTSARQRLAILEETVLPSAVAAYDASIQGYAAGKFDLTTTFDARNALLEAERSVLDAKHTLRVETARLKSLVGAAPFSGEQK